MQPDSDSSLIQEPFERRKRLAQSHLQRALKRLLNAIRGLEDERQRFLLWEEVQHEALLLQANLYKVKRGMREVIVSDWNRSGAERTLQLDEREEPHEQLNKRFRQARRLKGGLEHLALRQEKHLAQQKRLEQRLADLEAISTPAALEAFCQQARIQLEPRKAEDPADRLPYYIFHTAGGWELWAGRSARDNDRMTFQCARGSDWWFHISGMSGSHIILRQRSGLEPDNEAIQAAIQLALHYSKGRLQGEGEVVMTQCKCVRRFNKNTPGKVQISNQRHYHARYQPEVYRNLIKG